MLILKLIKIIEICIYWSGYRIKKKNNNCIGEEINFDITNLLSTWTSSKRQGLIAILLLQLHQKRMAVYFEEKVGFLSRLKIDMESWVGLFLFYKRNVFLISILLRISWCSYIYQILKERNRRVRGWMGQLVVSSFVDRILQEVIVNPR